jgi:ring-1,2-phenylacetyl-CoA epoxidase subunit PaaD
MSANSTPASVDIWNWLAEIPDPEVPAISIVDLGIVREVHCEIAPHGLRAVVTITPTYTGCPAMDWIASEIRQKLGARGIDDVRLVTRLSPPWTTEWLAPQARERLREFGIAPPGQQAIRFDIEAGVGPSASAAPRDALQFVFARSEPAAAVACPRCGASTTECVSEFGSTACKAQYRCLACGEPFDYFKPI